MFRSFSATYYNGLRVYTLDEEPHDHAKGMHAFMQNS